MSINVYELVTNRIIEQLEKGVIPWRKTWQGSEPINYITRNAYRGINTLLLPYGGEYLSFKQCKDLGGSVRKGEKGHMSSMTALSPECNSWAVSETARKRKPNKMDIWETQTIFDAMCIDAEIPKEFVTLSQLMRWRKAVIDEVFSQ